jgi:hypothetical protein
VIVASDESFGFKENLLVARSGWITGRPSLTGAASLQREPLEEWRSDRHRSVACWADLCGRSEEIVRAGGAPTAGSFRVIWSVMQNQPYGPPASAAG